MDVEDRDDFWRSFIAGHLDANDGMLDALAEAVGDSMVAGEAPEPTGPAAASVSPGHGQAVFEQEQESSTHLEPVDITEGLTDEQVKELSNRATFINPKLLGYNGRSSIIGIEVSNQLRDLLIEAYDHYQDGHECVGAVQLLDRITEQLISAFHVARGRTEGDD